MKKTFSLPKNFTEEWIKNLRSNEYQQGGSYLAELDQKNSVCKYCCLGVAMKTLSSKDEDLLGIEIPSYANIPENFPLVLQDTIHDNNLVEILTFLNDGFPLSIYQRFKENHPHINFSRIPESEERIKYSFIEIADWIENNVELI